jgi:hypothetical protein
MHMSYSVIEAHWDLRWWLQRNAESQPFALEHSKLLLKLS